MCAPWHKVTFSRNAIRKRTHIIYNIYVCTIYRYLHITPNQIPRSSTPHLLSSFFFFRFSFVIIARKITRISGNFEALFDRKCIRQKNLIRNLASVGHFPVFSYISYCISRSMRQRERKRSKRARRIFN